MEIPAAHFSSLTGKEEEDDDDDDCKGDDEDDDEISETYKLPPSQYPIFIGCFFCRFDFRSFCARAARSSPLPCVW